MKLRACLTIAGLVLLVIASVAVRVIVYSVPDVSNRIPIKPYARSVNYADIAENVLSDRGYVINENRVARVLGAWDSGTRLPPEPSDFALAAGDTFKPAYDEQGYVLLQVGLANMVGGFHWSNVLHLQAILSGIATLLVFFVTRRLQPGWAPWLIALLYTFHPLEIILSVMPDLPVWSIYASVVAAAVAIADWRVGSWIDWVQLICAGAFLGLCVVIRAPTVGIVVIALAAMLFVSFRAHWFAALLVAFGGLLSISCITALDGDTPTVGRSATFHTLLGGLSEFGHIEGLEWQDSAIHDYITARHAVDLYTPEFNEAARIEYLNVVQNRPELLIIVPARRLLEFILAYRPGKSSVGLVFPFTIFKILAIASVVVWWQQTEGAQNRRRIIAYLAVASATVFVHVLIVPLLEVYIASFFILWSFPIAGLGTLIVCRRFRSTALGGGGCTAEK